MNVDNQQDFLQLNIRYHEACIRTYELNYIRSSQKSEVSNPQNHRNTETDLNNLFQKLELEIESAKIFSLSDISNLLKQEYGLDYLVQPKNIKKYLIKYFGERISFIYPNQKNKSQLLI